MLLLYMTYKDRNDTLQTYSYNTWYPGGAKIKPNNRVLVIITSAVISAAENNTFDISDYKSSNT